MHSLALCLTYVFVESYLTLRSTFVCSIAVPRGICDLSMRVYVFFASRLPMISSCIAFFHFGQSSDFLACPTVGFDSVCTLFAAIAVCVSGV